MKHQTGERASPVSGVAQDRKSQRLSVQPDLMRFADQRFSPPQSQMADRSLLNKASFCIKGLAGFRDKLRTAALDPRAHGDILRFSFSIGHEVVGFANL